MEMERTVLPEIVADGSRVPNQPKFGAGLIQGQGSGVYLKLELYNEGKLSDTKEVTLRFKKELFAKDDICQASVQPEKDLLIVQFEWQGFKEEIKLGMFDKLMFFFV